MSLILFILVLGIIIVVHEAGHFLMAKLFNVYVHEFSLGMGPKIFSKKGKNGETEYSLRALPIGGFVALEGEEPTIDSKIPEDRRLYRKPAWQRFLIMSFGIINNLILAIILFFAIFLVYPPLSSEPVLTKPMFENGLKENDLIVEVDRKKIKTIDDVQLRLALLNGEAKELKPVTIKVKRADAIKEIKLNPQKYEGQEKYGVSFKTERLSRKCSFKAAIKALNSNVKQIFIVFGNLISGNLSVKTLTGPVGIYQAVDVVKTTNGLAGVLLLMAIISVNVGIINLLPLPVMDGGKILFLLIEKIRGKAIDSEFEYKMSVVSFVLLMILALYITGQDIIKLINK